MHHAFAVALLLAAPASATTIVLDFEEEALGNRRDGERHAFVSVECGCVRLIEPLEGDSDARLRIQVAPFGRSDGHAVYVGHEGGGLLLEFLVPVFAVSIDFGNDYPEDEADARDPVFKAFAEDDALLDEDTVSPNDDRIVNQTLSLYSESPIHHATFGFRQLGQHSPLDFYVDNLVLTTVPEPGAVWLAALACIGLLRNVRRET